MKGTQKKSLGFRCRSVLKSPLATLVPQQKTAALALVHAIKHGAGDEAAQVTRPLDWTNLLLITSGSLQGSCTSGKKNSASAPEQRDG